MQTDSPKTAKVEFVPPKSQPVPDMDSDNDTFDLVCSFRPSEGGKVCMVKYGNADMPGYGEKSETQKPEVKPDYSAMARQLSGGMAGGGAVGAGGGGY